MKLGDYVYIAELNFQRSDWIERFNGFNLVQGMVIAFTDEDATLKLNTWFYDTKCVARKLCFASREAAYKHFFGS